MSVFDLSAAYGRPPGSVRGGAALLGRQIAIEDEIALSIDQDVLWTMHVVAEEATVQGSLARLRMGPDRFEAHILEPSTARFVLSPPPPPRQFAVGDHPFAIAVDGALDNRGRRVRDLIATAQEQRVR